MGDRKDDKTLLKQEKKRFKAEVKREKKARPDAPAAGPRDVAAGDAPPSGSAAAPADTRRESGFVHFAEGVRGLLAILFALSLLATLVLPDKGVVITLNELIRRLMPLLAGKILLGLIAAAFVLYGLKCLRAIR